jgi:outer membrane protein insertion porin family
MAKIFLIFFLLIVLTSQVLYASQRFSNKRIRNIIIDSPINISKRDIRDLILLKKGDMYSRSLIRRSLELIYARGLFSNIIIEAIPVSNEIDIIYHLIPKDFIKGINVRGNKIISKDDILSIIDIKEGDEYYPEKVYKAINRLKAEYKKRGYYLCKIEEETSKKKEIIFIIYENEPARIKNVEIEGRYPFSKDEIVNILKIEKGTVINEIYLDKNIEKLSNMFKKKGFYEVRIDEPVIKYNRADNSVSLKISITSGYKIKIDMNGNREFSKDYLLKVMELDKEPILREFIIEKLKLFYHSKGFYFFNASVNIEIDERKQEKTIHISINEGNRVKVGSIAFKGNRHIKEKLLRREMLSKKQSLFNDGIFVKEIFDEDLQAILSLYKRSGFLNASIKKEFLFNNDKSIVYIKVIIDEGVQTIINSINIKGSESITKLEILNTIKIRRGLPINMELIEEDKERILSIYLKKGFINTDISIDIKYSKDRKYAYIIYDIKEGNRVKVGRILPNGNYYTKDKVIKRVMTFKEGSPFSPEDIFRSERRIRQLGIFKYVDIKPINDGSVRDLIVEVKERKGKAFEFGFGYGTYEKFRGFLEFSDRNLAGYGRYLSIGGEKNGIENRYMLRFREPWLFNRPYNGNIEFMKQTIKKYQFHLRKNSFTLGFEKRLAELTRLIIDYDLEFDKLFNLKEGAILSSKDIGKRRIGALGISFVRDSRDDPFNPKKGAFNSFRLEYSDQKIGSQIKFLKLNIQSSLYIPVRDEIIANISLRGGRVQSLKKTSEIPIHKRFFLGGRDSVRGFSEDSIGPKGKDGVATGGNIYILFNGEVQFPIWLGFKGLIFIDSGNVWLKDRDVDLFNLRLSAGFGLRYKTPIGPISLDYGFKLNRKDQESRGSIHFSIGARF